MKHPYDPTEYLYLSARLRARLGTAEPLSAEKLSVVSYEEALRLLGGENTDAILDQRLWDAFRLAQEFSPDPSFIRLFSYPYDCQNLKLALKYDLLSAPEPPELFRYGTVPEDGVIRAVRERNFSAFSPAIAQAAGEALESFEKSGDIQRLDLLLDLAAFEDMLASALEFGCAFLIDLVRFRIDCYHLAAFCRMKCLDMGMELFADLFYKGAGGLELAFFEPFYDKSANDFIRRVAAQKEFSGLRLDLDSDAAPTSAVFQAELERLYYEKARSAMNATYGAEPVIAYLLSEEAQIKQIRKLISDKRRDAKGTTIDG